MPYSSAKRSDSISYPSLICLNISGTCAHTRDTEDASTLTTYDRIEFNFSSFTRPKAAIGVGATFRDFALLNFPNGQPSVVVKRSRERGRE